MSTFPEQSPLVAGALMKFLITHATSTRIWLIPDSQKSYLDKVKQRLDMIRGQDLKKWTEPGLQDACLVRHLGALHRAKILSFKEGGYLVYLVDIGEEILTADVFEVPFILKKIPPLARFCMEISNEDLSNSVGLSIKATILSHSTPLSVKLIAINPKEDYVRSPPAVQSRDSTLSPPPLLVSPAEVTPLAWSSKPAFAAPRVTTGSSNATGAAAVKNLLCTGLHSSCGYAPLHLPSSTTPIQIFELSSVDNVNSVALVSFEGVRQQSQYLGELLRKWDRSGELKEVALRYLKEGTPCLARNKGGKLYRGTILRRCGERGRVFPVDMACTSSPMEEGFLCEATTVYMIPRELLSDPPLVIFRCYLLNLDKIPMNLLNSCSLSGRYIPGYEHQLRDKDCCIALEIIPQPDESSITMNQRVSGVDLGRMTSTPVTSGRIKKAQETSAPKLDFSSDTIAASENVPTFNLTDSNLELNSHGKADAVNACDYDLPDSTSEDEEDPAKIFRETVSPDSGLQKSTLCEICSGRTFQDKVVQTDAEMSDSRLEDWFETSITKIFGRYLQQMANEQDDDESTVQVHRPSSSGKSIRRKVLPPLMSSV